MNFLFVSFWAAFKEQRKSLRTWIFALLLPLLTGLLVWQLQPSATGGAVTVGVYIPESANGEAYWQLLEQRSGSTVSFVQADPDTLNGMVAAGVWDCGLILSEDFETKANELNTKGLIRLVISDGSTAYPLVQETASACLLEYIGPTIAQQYLLDSGIATEETLPSMEGRIHETLPEEERTAVKMETIDGKPLDSSSLTSNTLQRLLRGIIAVLLLLWALFLSEDLGRWGRTAAARRLAPLRGAGWLLLPRALAATLPIAIATTITAFLLPADGTIPATMAWLVFLLGLSLLCARWTGVHAVFPVLAPAMPVLALITSPILLDPGSLSPILGTISQYNPLTLYLQAADGALYPAVLLILLGIGLTALSLIPQKAAAKHRT